MKLTDSIHNYSLTVRNKLSEIENIVEAVNVLAHKWQLTEKIVHQLNLALEEVISNIIFYAFNDDLEHYIVIVFSHAKNKIFVNITDDGKYFNILEAKNDVDIAADIEDRKVGGLGIHILKEIVDDLDYQRKDNQNILRLTKQL